MRRLNTLSLLFALVALAASASPRAEQAKSDAAGVNVTVKYTGKGMVDPDHKLWVWLFDTPDIGPDSMPIAEESLEENGATASFSNLTAKEVYVAVAFDEAGGFAGQAPPPPGSPIAIYGSKTMNDPAQAVMPGEKGSVSITFDDTQRMQGAQTRCISPISGMVPVNQPLATS